MIILITVLFILMSGFLYRLGGLSKEQAKEQIPWCPSWLINSKTRDIGCPLACIGWMLLFFPSTVWYWHLIAFGLMWGSLTTYWDFINGDDNFWLHGFGVGMAYLPYCLDADLILGGILRAIALAILMGAWCAIFNNDWVEELGRGAFIVATLPILLI